MDEETATWLRSVKAVLLAKGFKRDPKQFHKPHQVWGVIRQEDADMQIHVRAFTDGRLESEVELSNRYMQHFWSKRTSAHEEVAKILEEVGFPTELVSTTFKPRTGSHPDKIMPDGRVRQSHAALATLLGIGILAGQFYIKGWLLKRYPTLRIAEIFRKLP